MIIKIIFGIIGSFIVIIGLAIFWLIFLRGLFDIAGLIADKLW